MAIHGCVLCTCAVYPLWSPVKMPSLIYHLIFAKKQRITFFDPLGRWVGWNWFLPSLCKILRVIQPLSQASEKPVWLYWLSRIFHTFVYIIQYLRFRHCYFICSKENQYATWLYCRYCTVGQRTCWPATWSYSGTVQPPSYTNIYVQYRNKCVSSKLIGTILFIG